MKARRTNSDRKVEPQIAPSPVPEISEGPKLSQEEEAELVQQVLQGNPDALEKLYDSYIDGIYRYIYGKVRSKSEAEPLTSETFTRALEALVEGRYTWQGKPFVTWLLGIADNVIREWMRVQTKSWLTEDLEGLPEHKEPVSKESGPLEVFIRQEERDAVWGLVSKLAPVERKLLYLRYVYELPFAAVAERLDRSEAACKQLHYRTLQKLKQLAQEIGLQR